MPGPYNAPESLTDARALARRLAIGFEVIPIGELFSTVLKSMAPIFGDLPHDFTEENLQARLRGMILMAMSNKFHRLLLSTGNKSEISVGYCTLYGDMNGGLACPWRCSEKPRSSGLPEDSTKNTDTDPRAHTNASPLGRVARKPDGPGHSPA